MGYLGTQLILHKCEKIDLKSIHFKNERTLVNKFYFRMIHKILEDGCDSNGGDVPQKPQAVVIAPTRELAIQIKVIY